MSQCKCLIPDNNFLCSNWYTMYFIFSRLLTNLLKNHLSYMSNEGRWTEAEKTGLCPVYGWHPNRECLSCYIHCTFAHELCYIVWWINTKQPWVIHIWILSIYSIYSINLLLAFTRSSFWTPLRCTSIHL